MEDPARGHLKEWETHGVEANRVGKKVKGDPEVEAQIVRGWESVRSREREVQGVEAKGGGGHQGTQWVLQPALPMVLWMLLSEHGDLIKVIICNVRYFALNVIEIYCTVSWYHKIFLQPLADSSTA